MPAAPPVRRVPPPRPRSVNVPSLAPVKAVSLAPLVQAVPVVAALPAVQELFAPITAIENTGVQIANTIAHILGAEESLVASACVPGQAGWPACATPGGSIAALEHAGLSAPAATQVAMAVASGTLGGGAARALSSVDVRHVVER
jgi:hypothetical protein